MIDLLRYVHADGRQADFKALTPDGRRALAAYTPFSNGIVGFYLDREEEGFLPYEAATLIVKDVTAPLTGDET